jgi:hypothetical protein
VVCVCVWGGGSLAHGEAQACSEMGYPSVCRAGVGEGHIEVSVIWVKCTKAHVNFCLPCILVELSSF